MLMRLNQQVRLMGAVELERIHTLETSVAVIKRDSDTHTEILEKLERTIESNHDVTEALHRMISIHEEKFNTQDKTNDHVQYLIADRREEALKDHESVLDKVENLEIHIMEKLEEYKRDILNQIDLKLVEKPTAVTDKHPLWSAIIENWKYIVFGLVFLAAVVTHKWTLFTTLFG